MAKELTARKLQALKRKPPKPGTTRDVDDGEVPGLKARVMPSGERSFVLVGRFPGSQNPTRRSLGMYGELTLSEARDKARKWRELLKRGIDPRDQEERDRRQEQRKRANTFAAVAEDFITDKLPSERKGREVERDIRREFIPLWGGRPITDIEPIDGRAAIKAVKDRPAPAQARNL